MKTWEYIKDGIRYYCVAYPLKGGKWHVVTVCLKSL